MGFFDFLFEKHIKRKEYLLRWQSVVMTDSPDKLVMTEEQLKAATRLQAENDLRILNDCLRLIETTLKPDVFFMRLNLLVEKNKHLSRLEEYIAFSGASPTSVYNEVINQYQEAINQFLIRYFSDTFDKAEAMKTENGRISKYQKFYDSLQEYYSYMNEENIDYIETKYRAYTRKSRKRCTKKTDW